MSNARRKTLPWLWILSGCLVLLLLFFVIVWVYPWFSQTIDSSADSGSVNLFTDGSTLYYTDPQEGGALYAYDRDTGRKEVVIDASVVNCFFSEDAYLFTTDTGLYYQEKSSDRTDLLLSFDTLVSDPTTTLRGKELLDSAIDMGCSCFYEMNGTAYFLFRAVRDLYSDEHTIVGEEQWSTVFSLDLQSRMLTKIKSFSSLVSYLSATNTEETVPQDLYVSQGRLFYVTQSNEIHALDLDGTDTILYSTSNRMLRHYWSRDRLYWLEIEYAESDGTDSAKTDQLLYGVYSLSEERWISPFVVSSDDRWNNTWVALDTTDGLFYAFDHSNLVTFSWENPQTEQIVCSLNTDMTQYNVRILFIDGQLYYAYYPLLSKNPTKDTTIACLDDQQSKILVTWS